MDDASHGEGATTHGPLGSPAPPPVAAVQWPLLAGIAAATLAVCLISTLAPCLIFRFMTARAVAQAETDPADSKDADKSRREKMQLHQIRVARITGYLTALGVGVILAMVFIGLMPATAAAFKRLCAASHRCLAAATLAPSAGCLGACLLLWLARAGAVEIKKRRGRSEEAQPLVAEPEAEADSVAAGCCSDATPSALQDPTTAALITAALLLKAVVEGLAIPNMLTVASPLFIALGKCLHELCCGLVVGLAWSDTVGGNSGSSPAAQRWGIFALVAYAVAASGSVLLGGLTVSVHSTAGAAVQFALLVAASGAGLQAAFVHILPHLPDGPGSPALALLGALMMAVVAATHHAIGGGGGHGGG